jgi:hypothetical protein
MNESEPFYGQWLKWEIFEETWKPNLSSNTFIVEDTFLGLKIVCGFSGGWHHDGGFNRLAVWKNFGEDAELHYSGTCRGSNEKGIVA